MKKYYGFFALFIVSWVNRWLNVVFAANVPSSPLNIDLSSAVFPNIADFNSSFLNATSLGDIDPAFGFTPIFGGIKLRAVPCLVNSVNAALQLALGDFEGFISATVFRLDSYPQVEIAVVPDEEGGSIPQKYAVWGLSIGIDLMMRSHDFQTAVFIITYQGQGIGCITYEEPKSFDSLPIDITNSTQSLGQTLPLSNTTKAALQTYRDANTTSMNTVDALNDSPLRIDFQLTAKVITIYNIFFMAIDMLRELAAYARSAQFLDFSTHLELGNLDVSTKQTTPPRTPHDPPYFQMEWLMRALAQTPTYMLEHRSFREVDMVLYVDEVKVGEISIKTPRSGTGLMQASDDISTS